MTRDCLDPGLALRLVEWSEAGSEGLLAVRGTVEADDDFFAAFDIEILRSVDSGVVPHHRSPASATEPAGQDLWASWLPERATVPLQSRANASPFWIMFLLSSGTFEREIIEVIFLRGFWPTCCSLSLQNYEFATHRRFARPPMCDARPRVRAAGCLPGPVESIMLS
jgi:hypothetical protein